jgi:hypothetical protein
MSAAILYLSCDRRYVGVSRSVALAPNTKRDSSPGQKTSNSLTAIPYPKQKSFWAWRQTSDFYLMRLKFWYYFFSHGQPRNWKFLSKFREITVTRAGMRFEAHNPRWPEVVMKAFSGTDGVTLYMQSRAVGIHLRSRRGSEAGSVEPLSPSETEGSKPKIQSFVVPRVEYKKLKIFQYIASVSS